MKGWIYIFSNPVYKHNLIKIGKTAKDPSKRLKELQETGMPSPFVQEWVGLVEEYDFVETRVHEALDSYRWKSNREFFTCTVAEAISAVKGIATILHEENNYRDPNVQRLELMSLLKGHQNATYQDLLLPDQDFLLLSKPSPS